MILILGEWRKGKVRPIPGNAPHGRPVSRGIVSSKSIGDDSLGATRFRSFKEHTGPTACVFLRHGGIYRPDVVLKPNLSRPPPVGRPRPRSKNASGGPRSSHRPR